MEKEYIIIIKQFVEGEMLIKHFEKLCKESETLISFIKANQYDNIINKINSINWGNIFHQDEIHSMFCRFLDKLNIDFNPTNIYIDKCRQYYSVIPDWLNDSAVEWVDENILSKVPSGYNKTQRKKWVKEQVEKTFPCEKRKPSWAQGTEDWPQDEEGNFLTFIKQKEKGEEVTYYFENKKTGEIVELKEWY